MLGTSALKILLLQTSLKLITWCEMTTKSALDILLALVNPPYCYKLGVSAINEYRTFFVHM